MTNNYCGETGLISSFILPVPGFSLSCGTVTGFSVFLKIMINPKANKIAFVSRIAVEPLNERFEPEVRRACGEEGIESAGFRRVASYEEEIRFYEDYDKKSSTAGASVVRYDIGAQMAEKDRSLNFPQSLISAAYRVCTDYEGQFLGNES